MNLPLNGHSWYMGSLCPGSWLGPVELGQHSAVQCSAVQRGEEQQALKTHTKNGKAPSCGRRLRRDRRLWASLWSVCVRLLIQIFLWASMCASFSSFFFNTVEHFPWESKKKKNRKCHTKFDPGILNWDCSSIFVFHIVIIIQNLANNEPFFFFHRGPRISLLETFRQSDIPPRHHSRTLRSKWNSLLFRQIISVGSQNSSGSQLAVIIPLNACVINERRWTQTNRAAWWGVQTARFLNNHVWLDSLWISSVHS